jgi:hypothetical protein
MVGRDKELVDAFLAEFVERLESRGFFQRKL